MAIDKDKVQKLLGSGLSNEIVATAVGCESSYIAQLMADDDFAAVVVAMRTVTLTAHTTRDRNIDGLEDSLLEKLREVVDSNLIYKPTELLRAFSVVNSAKRRGVAAHESLVVNNTVVNLTIPSKVVQQFVKNGQGEIIEVAGQSLVTMPAHMLLKNLINNRAGGESGTYERVSKFLPTTIDQEPVPAQKLDNFKGMRNNT